MMIQNLGFQLRDMARRVSQQRRPFPTNLALAFMLGVLLGTLI